MSTPLSAKSIFLTTVLRRRTLCREHFELTLTLPTFPPASPGQFLQVLCREPEPAGDQLHSPVRVDASLLRRPFSIGGLRRESDHVEVDLLGRVIGPGTAWLDARRSGDHVDVLGPLGAAYSIPARDHSALLVAGGIGLPPIRWHAEILSKSGIKCDAIFGAQTRGLIPLTLQSDPAADGEMTLCAEEFARDNVPLAITTDDGSCGLRGRVTAAVERYLARQSDTSHLRVYACGPEPMLRAVADICVRRRIHCELAMERVMACGMGTCQSCVVPIFDPARDTGWRYALCCTEGPVFLADRVKWD